MAYANGVSASINDVMAAVRSFAQAQGFTASATWGTGGYDPAYGDFGALTAMALSKEGTFYHFAWNDTFVLLSTATGSLGSGMPQAQPNADPRIQVVGPFKGPHIGYHLFSQGSRIHAVIEYATNVFMHFSFGQIDKTGNWAGGGYVTGAFWNRQLQGTNPPTLYSWETYVHNRPFDSLATYGANAGIGNAAVNPSGHMRTDYAPLKTMETGVGPYLSNRANSGQWTAWAYALDLVYDSPNMFNNRAVLVPIQINMQTVALLSDESQFSRMQMGQLNDVATVNMTLLNPKDIINNDWMVFPVSQKNGDSINFINSGVYGLAYRK